MENTEVELIGRRRGWAYRLITRSILFNPILQCDDILSDAALWLQMYSLSWYLNHALPMKDKGLFVYKRGISYTMPLWLLSCYQIATFNNAGKDDGYVVD